jgi:hypothetical protein
MLRVGGSDLRVRSTDVATRVRVGRCETDSEGEYVE